MYSSSLNDYIDVHVKRLLKNLLKKQEFHKINPLVDLYNLISMDTKLALGAHDLDKIEGNITLRLTQGNENYIPLGSEPRFFALLLPSVCRNARGYSSRSTYSSEKAFPTALGCSKSSLRSLSKSTTREAHTGCCGVLITPSHRCRCWYSLFQLPFSPRVPPHANDKLTAPRSFHRQPHGRPFLRLSERAHILPYESGTHLLNRPPGLFRIPL